jgi:short-subunit dehydrogenase
MKVLITGASSGIGRDMARTFSKKGYDLVLVARDENKLNNAKEELEKNNIKVEVIVMDLANEENCIELHKKAKDIDILINNACFGDCGDFSKTDLKKEMNMIKTNITAYHILTKLYLIDMKKKNSGKILNVASIAGFMPGPLMATYYATKAYVVRLSEGIREELKKEKSNVKISILCPGPVDTNFNKVANV